MAQAMTPTDAVNALNDLPRYEEGLTARTAGLTSMVWGLVGAAIFLTYGSLGAWIEEVEAWWLLSLLWIPWVAAGIVYTGALWRSHAVTLRKKRDSKSGVLYSIAMTLVFLAIAAGLFLILDVLAGVELDVSGLMTVVNGLFAIALAALSGRWKNCGRPYLIGAGIAMVAVGLVLGVVGLPAGPSDLAGALVVAAGWMTAGLLTYVKG